jgi:hypothetical protein
VEKAALDHSATAAGRCLLNSLLPKPNWNHTDAVTSKLAHAKKPELMTRHFFPRENAKTRKQNPIDLKIMQTSVCESIHTQETVPADDLVFLPESVQVLPFKTTVCVTRNLWRSLIGNSRFFPRDELLEDVSSYLTFALLGLVGFDLQRTPTTDSMLMPIVCRSGSSVMRLTLHRPLRLMTLSLPGEILPIID